MSVKIDIISGFLGAGKTTLINKLLKGKVLGENIAIVENEYGDINIDSGRIEESQVEIKSITSGCICCSLQGEFDIAMKELIDEYRPNRIIIEPTGVGKLSDIIGIINRIKENEDVSLNMVMTIVDVLEFEDFIEIFGSFFTDQIEYANTIILSKTQLADEGTADEVIESIREINRESTLITSPWDELSAKEIMGIAELGKDIDIDLEHHHHEDQEFEDWSLETSKRYHKEELQNILDKLNDGKFGKIYRAKGALHNEKGQWLNFDFSPSSVNIKDSKVGGIGQIVVIGQDLERDKIRGLWK